MKGISAWTWAAAFAPLLAILPTEASQAGAGGWIAPLLALPVVLGMERLLRRLAGNGLAAGFSRVLGAGAGRILTIIYMVWASLLGGALLKASIRRVELATTPGIPTWLLAAGVVLLAVWFACGRPEFCARWAVVTLNGLFAVLGALVLLALGQVQRDNLLPLRLGNGGVLRAIAVALGALCVRVYGAFLEETGHNKPRYLPVVCGLVALLLLTVQGVLGAELATRLEDPVLTLARNVGVEGGFQRAESVAAAILLTADLALLTLLLWAARRGAEQLWEPRCGRYAGLAVAAVALGCALWPTEEAFARLLRQRVIPGGNLVLGLVVPLVLVIIGRKKAGKNGAYLVAEKEENGTY